VCRTSFEDSTLLARTLVFALLLGSATAHAQELSSNDPGGEMRQFGLWGRAERIVHNGQPWLLVTLRAQQTRYRQVSRGNGITESVEIRELSLCRDTRRIAAGGMMPMYLVFPYPEPGPVMVHLPITVVDAASPGPTTLRLSVLIPERAS
jgi:hypothetical protein